MATSPSGDTKHSEGKSKASWRDLLWGLLGRDGRAKNESGGSEWEARAAEFLRKKGYRLLARNVRMRRGELDIVAADGDEIVFVEVKQRKSLEFGGGDYAIDFKKRHRLISAAAEFLSREGLTRQPCRFDTVIIHTGPEGPEFNHTENAFQADR